MRRVLQDDHGAGFLLSFQVCRLPVSVLVRQVQGGGLETGAFSGLITLTLSPRWGRGGAEGWGRTSV